MKKLPIAMLLALVLAGCQSAGVTTGDYTGQGLLVTHQAATPATVVVTRKDGTITTGERIVTDADNPVVSVVVISPQPAKSTYTITPEKQAGDKYIGHRVLSWATKSPNMVASEVVAERKAKETKAMPAVRIDATGINAEEGGGSTSQDTGISWVTRVRNWLSQLWSWLTMTGFWIAILLLAVFIVLPIIFPALAPIVRSIWLTIVRAVKGVWNWIVGRFTKVRAENAEVGGRRATDPPPTDTPPTTPPTA